jgi:hypothetical protein
MLSWFRRQSQPSPPNYRDRVEAFWKNFSEAAPRFFQTIEDKRSPDLTEETSALVHALAPQLAWAYGPGTNGQGHSLTISGEGIEHRQLLAQRWLEGAPSLPGWTFYASRQPGPIKGHVISMGGNTFDPREIWVTPHLDAEAEKIDLNIWHPAWADLPNQQRWTLIFLFLDESLGEFGTQWWIGEITWSEERLRDAFPLEELAEYVQKTSAEQNWKKHPPGESWTLFRFHSDPKPFPRGDLIILTTSVPLLLHEYMEAEGDLADPLEGTGADYIYVALEKGFFPQGRETEKRGELEDALDDALRPGGRGRVIGGGLGRDFGYVDLLIFDGARSLETVRSTLQNVPVPSGTMIEFFAREKRTHRIAL